MLQQQFVIFITEIYKLRMRNIKINIYNFIPITKKNRAQIISRQELTHTHVLLVHRTYNFLLCYIVHKQRTVARAIAANIQKSESQVSVYIQSVLKSFEDVLPARFGCGSLSRAIVLHTSCKKIV